MGGGEESWVFDSMNGTFEARLRRMTVQTKTSKGDGREITVSNMVAVVEAKFSYEALDRLYYPSFIAIEREVKGRLSHVIFEVVSINPTHYQQLGMDVSMPTVLRKEYLDTINESWGKSQETWIDLWAIPTWYITKVQDGEVNFERTRLAPLAGARAFLLSKRAVERFLCFEKGERIGTMIGFDLPLKINLENLVRYHSGFFGFSVDYSEPIIYRRNGFVGIAKIGELVDPFYSATDEGPVFTSSIEVVCFDQKTFEVKWAPLQYVFRHRYEGKLLRFNLRTGRSVAVTPAHSLFVVKNGRVCVAAASEIRKGDYLVGSRNVPQTPSENPTVDLLEFFSGSDSEGITLRGIPREGIARGLIDRRNSWRDWWWRSKGVIPLASAHLLPKEVSRKARISYKGCRSDLPTKLEVDAAVARLLGYYVAEGHAQVKPGQSYRIVFTLGKKDEHILNEIVATLIERFGITASIHQHGSGGIRVSFSHRLLAELFTRWVGTGAGNKRVPSIILNSPPKIRGEFLRAWVEGDYGVTVSPALMNDIMYMLLMEGCVGTTSRWRYTEPIVIEGRHVSSRLRHQLKFPRPADILDRDFSFRRRRRSEPLFPAAELPATLAQLYTHPSHLSSWKRGVNPRLLEELRSKLSTLAEYAGSSAKNAEEARHDGCYRMSMGRYIVRSDDKIQASQLLIDLPRTLTGIEDLTESGLAFFEVLDIEPVDSTSEFVYDVSVPGAENFLAGFGGVFCHNTGVGKSNLTSSLVRMAAKSEEDLTIVIFDVAGEYAVHLVDLLASGGRILTNELMEDAGQFYNSQAIPESLEDEVGPREIQKVLEGLYKAGVVERLALQEAGGLDLAWIQTLLEKTVGDAKAGGTTAIIALEKLSSDFYTARGLQPATRLSDLDDDAKKALTALLEEIRVKSHEKSGIRLEAEQILEKIMTEKAERGTKEGGLTPEKLAYELATSKAPRLNILYLPDPLHARMAASRLISRLLYLRKRLGNRGRILIVLDEAQEYIPDNPNDKQMTMTSNIQVEALLRQGRKYRVHCWLATQRVAHLNVSALQQLHSYFVSTLPRMYDRMVVADSFALPYEVLERSAQLESGEWIFVSYKATKQKGVPVFVRTENNESLVAEYLRSRK